MRSYKNLKERYVFQKQISLKNQQ